MVAEIQKLYVIPAVVEETPQQRNSAIISDKCWHIAIRVTYYYSLILFSHWHDLLCHPFVPPSK
jgi:hypothetical protein